MGEGSGGVCGREAKALFFLVDHMGNGHSTAREYGWRSRCSCHRRRGRCGWCRRSSRGGHGRRGETAYTKRTGRTGCQVGGSQVPWPPMMRAATGLQQRGVTGPRVAQA